MAIDASLLKDLRERTGAGIMDCKKALDESNGDVEAACKWLREKGIAKAVKKASRISAEGVLNAIVKGNTCTIYEVNCETDFVAKNEKFLNFVKEVGEVIVADGAKCTECALGAKNANGQTVEELRLEIIAKIGENITLRNVQVVEKEDNQEFGVYFHNGGNIVVVTVVEGIEDVQVCKQLAMHICANGPQYIDQTKIDPEYVKSETELLTKEAAEQNPNKPANIIEKMIQGRLQKELKAICLVDQPYLMNTEITVGDFLKGKNASVKSFVKLTVGEGIEKKENNFVEEVMSQIK